MGYEYSDGYYKNGACYGPVVAFAPTKFAGVEGCGDGENIGGKDVWNARAKLLWEPSSAFSALLQYELIRDTSESVPGVNETRPGELRSEESRVGNESVSEGRSGWSRYH